MACMMVILDNTVEEEKSDAIKKGKENSAVPCTVLFSFLDSVAFLFLYFKPRLKDGLDSSRENERRVIKRP